MIDLCKSPLGINYISVNIQKYFHPVATCVHLLHVHVRRYVMGERVQSRFALSVKGYMYHVRVDLCFR